MDRAYVLFHRRWVECDDALILLAAREVRTLDHREESQFSSHVESCDSCRAVKVATETESESASWIMRASGSSDDEPIVPTVNPSMFEIGEEVAAGGMGRVLRARDRRLGRMVAIKENLDPRMHARFEREALITARLQHPAIVPIYEAGMWPDGTRFYTMRLVPGQTLSAAIAEAEPGGRLALLRHVTAATEAVAHAHANQIIHRDLKPGNILVGELGETVVIDWGIARRLDDEEDEPESTEPSSVAIDRKLTRFGAVLGTPGYMAPEQARGEALDERADVFALGAVLYTLLAGDAPYALQHADLTALLARTGREPPPSIDAVAPDAPKDLRAVVAKAMAFDRAERYPTAREMAEDLRRFETGQLLARPYKTSELISRWVRRHKAAVSIGVLAVLALVVVSAVFVRGLAEARDTAEDKQVEAEVARASADHERTASEQALARSLEDQGRQAYLAGARDRALVFLAEAMRRGRDTPGLRQLLAAVNRDAALVTDRIKIGQSDWLGLAINQRRLVVVDDEKVRTWGGGEKEKFRLTRDPINQKPLPDGLDAVAATEHAVARYMLPLRSMRWSVPLDIAPGAELVLAPGRLAIATRGKQLVVLELASGKPLARLPFEPSIYAFSEDGRRLAAVTANGTLRLWGDNLEELASWTAPAGLTHLVVLDGDRVVTAGSREIRLWTRGAGDHVLVRGFDVQALVAAMATKLIAAGDNRGGLVVWSFEGEQRSTNYELDTIKALAFSPDGRMLAASDSLRTIVFDTHALAATGEVESPDVTSLAWRTDGRELAILGADLIRVTRPTGIAVQLVPSTSILLAGTSWLTSLDTESVVRSLETGAELGRFTGPVPIRSFTSADGTRMLVEGTAGRPREVRIVALPGGATVATFSASRARMSSDGQLVAMLDEDDAGVQLRVVDVSGKLRAEKVFARNDKIQGIEAGPDPRSLFVLRGNHVELVELETLAVRATFEIGFPARDLVLSPRGHRALVSQSEDNTRVATLDLASGAILDQRQIVGSSADLSFADDGNTFAMLVNRNRAEVYSIAQRSPLLVVPHITAGALAPDGTRLSVGNNHGGLEIWDVATGTLLESRRQHLDKIIKIEWIDQDRFVVQGGKGDLTATVWSVPRSRASVAEVTSLAAALPWRYQTGTLVRP